MRSKINSIAAPTPVTRAEVFSQAAQACQQIFSFASTARCSAQMLCSVLVWAAAYAGSFYQACQRLFPQTQDQTFWNLLRRTFPKRADALERRLTELLQLPWLLPRLMGRWLDVAVDYHAIPYHGSPKKNARELRRGKSERGTTKFHVYATVCVIIAGWRYTLALTWVHAKESPTQVLQRLWKQLESSGIRCKLVLLDRYFFNVQVMKWLQENDLPFIMPVVLRGRKPKKGKAAKGVRAYRKKKAGAYAYTHAHAGASVRFTLMVNYKSYRHHRTKKRGQKKWLFATWKIRRSPTEVRETYRRRFGIEASYRQLNQARARTSTRDPLYRLFVVGLALLLRNLWQWLTYLALKERQHQLPRDNKLTALPRLRDVLHAFANALQLLTIQTPGTGVT